MGYVFEWGIEQRVYLENVGEQTVVTTVSSSSGQQQQAGSSFQTGTWKALPEAYRVGGGVVVKILAAQGERFVQIQGSSLSTLGETPFLRDAEPLPVQQTDSMPVSSSMPSIAPMQPMQPMKMGDMEMDRKTMTMQMGNMQMSMNPMDQSIDHQSPHSNAPETSDAANQRKFCSQCGTATKPSDRFCASCGHRLD